MNFNFEIGNVQKIKEQKEYIELTIKFGEWKPTFTLLKEKCDIKQISKLHEGNKVYCILNGPALLYLFFEAPAYKGV